MHARLSTPFDISCRRCGGCAEQHDDVSLSENPACTVIVGMRIVWLDVATAGFTAGGELHAATRTQRCNGRRKFSQTETDGDRKVEERRRDQSRSREGRRRGGGERRGVTV